MGLQLVVAGDLFKLVDHVHEWTRSGTYCGIAIARVAKRMEKRNSIVLVGEIRRGRRV